MDATRRTEHGIRTRTRLPRSLPLVATALVALGLAGCTAGGGADAGPRPGQEEPGSPAESPDAETPDAETPDAAATDGSASTVEDDAVLASLATSIDASWPGSSPAGTFVGIGDTVITVPASVDPSVDHVVLSADCDGPASGTWWAEVQQAGPKGGGATCAPGGGTGGGLIGIPLDDPTAELSLSIDVPDDSRLVLTARYATKR